MKNFSIRTKLLSLSVFLVSISIVLGAISYWSLGIVIKDYSKVTDISFPNTTLMLETFLNVRQSRIQAMNIASDYTSSEEKAKAAETIAKNIESDQELHKKYLELDYLPGEEVLYLAFRKDVDENNTEMKKLLDLYKTGKTDAETIKAINDVVFITIAKTGVSTRLSLTKLKEFHAAYAKESMGTAREAGSHSITLIVALIAVFGSIGLVSAYFFSNSLTKSLRDISSALDESSTQVSSAAGQIATSAQELSQAATEQAASLEETSASVEEMSSMVNINTENAKKASDNSAVSKQQAERGRAVVEEMVQSMNLINESNNNIMNQINHSNEQMSEIVKVIQEIETKTKVINDIVFQTKLLSFNASVEAARAGEQGKGFAVVAEEVGNLAQMSGNAAKEISDMLASSVHKVESIVQETKSKVDVLIEDGKEKVKAGTKVAEECGEVLTEIVGNVSNVATMANEISVASDEQSKGIQEITKAMGQLDQVTQTNTATSEEAASAAEQLSAQAEYLKAQVLTLVGVINGAGTSVEVKPVSKPVHKEPVKDAKVMAFKKPAPAPAPVKKSAPVQAVAPKKVAGGSSLPDYDHPGFEEV